MWCQTESLKCFIGQEPLPENFKFTVESLSGGVKHWCHHLHAAKWRQVQFLFYRPYCHLYCRFPQNTLLVPSDYGRNFALLPVNHSSFSLFTLIYEWRIKNIWSIPFFEFHTWIIRYANFLSELSPTIIKDIPQLSLFPYPTLTVRWWYFM